MDNVILGLLISFGFAIFVECVFRLASMGWKTHKRGWCIVYGMLIAWGMGNVFLALDGKGHFIPLIGLMATALWLYESRNRWRDGAPKWMERNVDSKTPGVVPE